MTITPSGPAAYVGLEVFAVKMGRRSGTFVPKHDATATSDGQEASWVVVSGSGTGELAGLEGKAHIERHEDGSHTFTLSLEQAKTREGGKMVLSPVVFVHGLIGSLQVPDLLSYFPAGRALAPDLQGYGMLRDAAPRDISIDAQVEHLQRVVRGKFAGEPVHAVGHSVGGAIAMQFARAYPELVSSVVSVEGNFTLKDAFWTSSVARMGASEIDRMIAGFRDDPAGWLAGSGINADDFGLHVASQWLAHQPATTVLAMAESVVEVTGAPEYLPAVRSVFDRHQVHLVAGERSADGWDVPNWAKERAASFTVISGTGHLMMLERTAEFATLVRSLVAAPVSA